MNFIKASLAGVEPAAHSLEGCCSIQLSYRDALPLNFNMFAANRGKH
jgi:hypothetical protein